MNCNKFAQISNASSIQLQLLERRDGQQTALPNDKWGSSRSFAVNRVVPRAREEQIRGDLENAICVGTNTTHLTGRQGPRISKISLSGVNSINLSLSQTRLSSPFLNYRLDCL
ncbi:hypothetical protein CDAR_72921 [Caerostris darwini]|uniref:Uncharacterized protein n=1 Tax=Caerostris darwini TaxID=1538125 RepID=A0AAV4VNG2_9ARAC|nr:hypothetical protein CDAR_72921 [Caerostris darwini]